MLKTPLERLWLHHHLIPSPAKQEFHNCFFMWTERGCCEWVWFCMLLYFIPPLIIPWQVSHQVHHGLSSQDKVSYPLRLSHSALEQCSGGSWGSVTLASFPWFISWSMQRQSEKVTKILPCVMSGRNGRGGATKPALMHAQGSSFRTPGTVGALDIVHVTRFPIPSSLHTVHTASNQVLEVVKHK